LFVKFFAFIWQIFCQRAMFLFRGNMLMPAKVLVWNCGTSSVKIEVQGRDEKGRFLAAKEYVVPPETGQSVIVDEGQSIQVVSQEDAA
jgi:hypothetical protein